MRGSGAVPEPTAASPASGRAAEPAAPDRHRGWAATGLAGIGLSLAAFLWLALAGPSAVQPRLPGGGAPWMFHVDPSPYLAISLMAAGIVVGAAGTGCCLVAARRGWRPRTAWLLGAGIAVAALFAVTPPVGSSDHLNYAAYGHMAVEGLNPYTTTAEELGGPFGGAVEEWRTTPSIYGPILTWIQSGAAWIGGESVRTTVFVLSLLNGVAFVLVGLVLYLRTRDEGARLRGLLLWTVNPLLLFQLVSGAHNDVWGIAAAVLALTVFTRGAATLWRTFGTGLIVGAAVAIKLPAGLVGGGPAWHLLRSARDLRGTAVLFGGAGLTFGVAYGIVGLKGFDQVRHASDFISLANVWHLFGGAGGGVLGMDLPKPLISILSLCLLLYLVRLLSRALPSGDDRDVLRVAAALVLAWLFAATYALPWYDGLGWALLALLPWSRFDGVLLLRTSLLSLAYLPARAPLKAGLPDDLHWLVTGLRASVMPLVSAAVLALLIWTCLRPPRRVPAP
ncbi:hypothetical protein GCM10010468_32020 [Actinocorallia longicatena]|uniref:DUF2029 domain-containing protein n=1 Tax=Actinocorallia longicatena TaxID=111803 RepID=A0ABP6Q9K9_9ACTN